MKALSKITEEVPKAKLFNALSQQLSTAEIEKTLKILVSEMTILTVDDH